MRDLALVQIEQRQEDFYVIEAKALAKRHSEEDKRHADVLLSIAAGWLKLREKLATEMFGPKPLDSTLYDPWMRLDKVSVGRGRAYPDGLDAKFYARWAAIVEASGTARSTVKGYIRWARDPSKLQLYREVNLRRAQDDQAKDGLHTQSRALAKRLQLLLAEKGEAALISYVMEGCPRVKSK